MSCEWKHFVLLLLSLLYPLCVFYGVAVRFSFGRFAVVHWVDGGAPLDIWVRYNLAPEFFYFECHSVLDCTKYIPPDAGFL